MAKKTLLGPTIRPGTVVEFIHGNQPQLAFVMEEQSGKLRLWTINKRESKMPSARVLPWTGPVHSPELSKQEIQDLLNACQEKRTEVQSDLDVMEIWELSQGEVESAKAEWFADLIWESPTADQLAAMGRALLDTKTHFKFRPPDFEIYSEEKVEKRLEQAAEEKLREELVNGGHELFSILWKAHQCGCAPKIPDMDEKLEAQLEQLLRDALAETLDEKSNKTWNAVRKGLPDLPLMPLLLAQTWGKLPAHYNYHLDRADYHWGDDWSEKHAAALEEQQTLFDHLKQTPANMEFISIDSPTTRDIDDAFFVERTDGGGYCLHLALARPCLAWEFGSELDKDVADRATSIYLPEGDSHMMPEALGTGLYSLLENEPRPALVTSFLLGASGRLLSVEPQTGWVKIKKNDTYESTDTRMADGSDDMLAIAFELAEKLLENRVNDGACVIRNPDPKVELSGDPEAPEVNVVTKPPFERSELTISEFMILANSGLAQWAKDNGISLLHRTQAIGLPKTAAGVFKTPEEIMQVVRYLTPPLLEVTPKRHAALAVEPYAPVTSPLRRYTDFINMDQLCSFLDKGKPRLDAEELERLIPGLNARIQAAGKVQRFRPRYWKMVYMASKKKEPWSAVLVDDKSPMPCLAIPEVQINVRCPKKLLGDKLHVGQRFQVVFSKVNALDNDLKVLEANEE